MKPIYSIDKKGNTSSKLSNATSLNQRWISLKCAWNGWSFFIKEANAKIQLFIGVVSIFGAIILQLNSLEWMLLILVIATVLFAESINTAIELFADFIHPNYHSKIKIIKDVSAGAVLIISVASSVIGALLFLPKILKIFI